MLLHLHIRLCKLIQTVFYLNKSEALNFPLLLSCPSGEPSIHCSTSLLLAFGVGFVFLTIGKGDPLLFFFLLPISGGAKVGRGHLCQLINLAMHKCKVSDCVRLIFAWLLANRAEEWLCLNSLC